MDSDEDLPPVTVRAAKPTSASPQKPKPKMVFDDDEEDVPPPTTTKKPPSKELSPAPPKTIGEQYKNYNGPTAEEAFKKVVAENSHTSLQNGNKHESKSSSTKRTDIRAATADEDEEEEEEEDEDEEDLFPGNIAMGVESGDEEDAFSDLNIDLDAISDEEDEEVEEYARSENDEDLGEFEEEEEEDQPPPQVTKPATTPAPAPKSILKSKPQPSSSNTNDLTVRIPETKLKLIELDSPPKPKAQPPPTSSSNAVFASFSATSVPSFKDDLDDDDPMLPPLPKQTSASPDPPQNTSITAAPKPTPASLPTTTTTKPTAPSRPSALVLASAPTYHVVHETQSLLYPHLWFMQTFYRHGAPQSIYRLTDRTLLTRETLLNLNPQWIVLAEPKGDWAVLVLTKTWSGLWIPSKSAHASAWVQYESAFLRPDSKCAILVGWFLSSDTPTFVAYDLLVCLSELPALPDVQQWSKSELKHLLKGGTHHRVASCAAYLHQQVSTTVRSKQSGKTGLHLLSCTQLSLEAGGLKHAKADAQFRYPTRGYLLRDPNETLDGPTTRLSYFVPLEHEPLLVQMETSIHGDRYIRRPEQFHQDWIQQQTMLPLYTQGNVYHPPSSRDTFFSASACTLGHVEPKYLFEGVGRLDSDLAKRTIFGQFQETPTMRMLTVDVALPTPASPFLTIVGPSTSSSNRVPCLPSWKNHAFQEEIHPALSAILLAYMQRVSLTDVEQHFFPALPSSSSTSLYSDEHALQKPPLDRRPDPTPEEQFRNFKTDAKIAFSPPGSPSYAPTTPPYNPSSSHVPTSPSYNPSP